MQERILLALDPLLVNSFVRKTEGVRMRKNKLRTIRRILKVTKAALLIVVLVITIIAQLKAL